MHTVEAVIDEQGVVRLREGVTLSSSRRALVTILEEKPQPYPNETALLSQEALAADWNRREEDAAWLSLQRCGKIVVSGSDRKANPMRIHLLAVPLVLVGSLSACWAQSATTKATDSGVREHSVGIDG